MNLGQFNLPLVRTRTKQLYDNAPVNIRLLKLSGVLYEEKINLLSAGHVYPFVTQYQRQNH
jgi:hypothetical protein